MPKGGPRSGSRPSGQADLRRGGAGAGALLQAVLSRVPERLRVTLAVGGADAPVRGVHAGARGAGREAAGERDVVADLAQVDGAVGVRGRDVVGQGVAAA